MRQVDRARFEKLGLKFEVFASVKAAIALARKSERFEAAGPDGRGCRLRHGDWRRRLSCCASSRATFTLMTISSATRCWRSASSPMCNRASSCARPSARPPPRSILSQTRYRNRVAFSDPLRRASAFQPRGPDPDFCGFDGGVRFCACSHCAISVLAWSKPGNRPAPPRTA